MQSIIKNFCSSTPVSQESKISAQIPREASVMAWNNVHGGQNSLESVRARFSGRKVSAARQRRVNSNTVDLGSCYQLDTASHVWKVNRLRSATKVELAVIGRPNRSTPRTVSKKLIKRRFCVKAQWNEVISGIDIERTFIGENYRMSFC